MANRSRRMSHMNGENIDDNESRRMDNRSTRMSHKEWRTDQGE